MEVNKMENKLRETKLTKQEDNTYLLMQKTEDSMDLGGAFKVYNNVTRQIDQLENKITQVEKQIEENALQKSLEELQKGKSELETVRAEMKELVEPAIADAKEKLVKYIRAEKAKAGFSRISDTAQRLKLINQILSNGIVDLKLGIQIDNEICDDLKQKFDKI